MSIDPLGEVDPLRAVDPLSAGDPLRELVNDCVHCGFCLPACPTYQLWGEEMDSPRGRIHLIGQHLDGAPLTDATVGHLDACLGCMACVPACPSGVRYDRLIEATREIVEQEHPRSRRDRLTRAVVFALFPYPRRLRVARAGLRLYQRTGLAEPLRRSGFLARVSPALAAMESLAPPVTPTVRLPARIPAAGPQRATVGLLTGCIQGAFFSGVNAATARVLAAEGCAVVIPPGQGCCGALSAHVGRAEESRRLARGVIDTFEAAGVERVAVNVAGCGSAMKEYVELLREDPAYAARAAAFAARTRDVSELIAELGPVAPRHPLPVTIAYQDACHLANAQGIRSAPRQLLRGIPELVLRELPDGGTCCGSAGVYNLLSPEPARELGDRKAGHVLGTDARLLVSANPGCLLQIQAAVRRADPASPLAFLHTMEVLDASIRGVGTGALLAPVSSSARAPRRGRRAGG